LLLLSDSYAVICIGLLHFIPCYVRKKGSPNTRTTIKSNFNYV